MDIQVTIVFDERLYDSQRLYNISYAKDVNKVLTDLKAQLPELDNADIIDFLALPESLSARLEARDRSEFDAYLSTLPKTVAVSMAFKCDKPGIIRKLYEQLPSPTSYFFKINTCKIKDGECFFDEEALKDRCTIKGSPSLLSLWDKANECAKTLNDLQEKIKDFHKDMSVIEDLSRLSMGLLRNDGKGYEADMDRLRQLI